MAQPTVPPWIQALQQRDPEFATSYLDGVEKVTKQDVVAMANKYLGRPYVYLVVQPHNQGKQ